MRRLTSCAACVAVLSACNGDSVAPPASGLHIVSGASLTDTAYATVSSPLRVRVGGASAGTPVHFRILGDMPFTGSMLVNGQYPGATLQVGTDGSGVAAVMVRFGEHAGAAAIEVTVPSLQLTDTAFYTVLPGAPVAVRLVPGDTVVQHPATFEFRGVTVDRNGNPRTDPAELTLTMGDDVVRLDGRTVSTRTTGVARVRVTGTFGGSTATDSALVVVVPTGRIAWSTGPVHIAPPGSPPSLTFTSGSAPAWDPSGDRIVYATGGASLRVQPVTGAAHLLTPPGVSYLSWPVYSPDGQWIYFHAEYASNRRRIYRINREGGELTPITTELNAEAVSVAPDGQRIAYVSSGIIIRDLTSGAVDTLPAPADAVGPRWSPDGEWIAYTVGFSSRVNLIRPDGTGHHVVGRHELTWGINWSPDSRWIIGTDVNSRKLTLVHPGSGISALTRVDGGHPAWEW